MDEPLNDAIHNSLQDLNKKKQTESSRIVRDTHRQTHCIGMTSYELLAFIWGLEPWWASIIATDPTYGEYCYGPHGWNKDIYRDDIVIISKVTENLAENTKLICIE